MQYFRALSLGVGAHKNVQLEAKSVLTHRWRWRRWWCPPAALPLFLDTGGISGLLRSQVNIPGAPGSFQKFQRVPRNAQEVTGYHPGGGAGMKERINLSVRPLRLQKPPDTTRSRTGVCGYTSRTTNMVITNPTPIGSVTTTDTTSDTTTCNNTTSSGCSCCCSSSTAATVISRNAIPRIWGTTHSASLWTTTR